jgi:hypothetical protein
VTAPAPHRLYRASASASFILAALDHGCPSRSANMSEVSRPRRDNNQKERDAAQFRQ